MEHEGNNQHFNETKSHSQGKGRSNSSGSAEIMQKSASKDFENEEEKYGLHLDNEVSSSAYYTIFRRYQSARKKLPSTESI